MPFYAVLGTPYLCIINKKITDMEITKTTYDTLPGQIDYLIQEVLEIKDILMARIEKPEEIPKFMNKEQALKHFEWKCRFFCGLKKNGFVLVVLLCLMY